MNAAIPDLMRLARTSEEHLSRILTTLAQNLERIEDDAYSTLRAQSFEPSESTSHLWCIEHDQTLRRCERDDRVQCVVGARQDEGPGRSDPTGEAVDRHNSAKGILKQVRRDLEALERLVGHLDALVRPVEPVNGWDLTKHARATAKANEKPPEGCEPCGAHGSWVPPHTKNPTDVDGRLGRKQWLCRFHYGFVVTYGELPNPNEEAKHQAGQRVTRVVRQTDRLRRGLMEGRLT